MLRSAQQLVLGVTTWIVCLVSFMMPLWAQSSSVELSGKSEFELTTYTQDGAFTGQDYHYKVSAALEPELYWQSKSGLHSVVFTPFLRIDQQDSQRSHSDIRELSWTYVQGDWEWRLGLRKVFWGVTEFNHLVDIINQTDAVEAADGEEKLGQAMLNLSRVTDWGIVDILVLPGFRKRTFAGQEGRLRSALVVDQDNPSYESDSGSAHIDYALRWSHSLGVFDIGAYWFDGTARDPLLQPINREGRALLQPFYPQISRLGLDLQATVESWLWKLEVIAEDGYSNTNNNENFLAAQVGFEYTLYGMNNSVADLGLLLEYGWDERRLSANNIAQNDLYIGARLTLNDAQDTALLVGIAYDAHLYSSSVFIEASRRLNDRWTMALQGQSVSADDSRDPLFFLSKDDNIQLTLSRYF